MSRTTGFQSNIPIDIDLDLDVELDMGDNESTPPSDVEMSDNSSILQQLPPSPQSQPPFSPLPPSPPTPIDDLYDSDDSSNGDVDFYEIDTDSDFEEYPTYDITNMGVTEYANDLPELLVYDQEDYVNEWEHETIDTGPSCGPFLGESRTQIQDVDGTPEIFFQGLFDERMWTIISEATNSYARSKAVTANGNRCNDPTHPDYKKHCRLNNWSDTSPSDIKMFLAHTLIMGLVKKSDLEKYWNMNTKAKVPFFGQYMSRNRYQSLLWNFHINDDSGNPRVGRPDHDPLCKIRPFVDMLDRNFTFAYKPSKALAFDEACCPFKGRLRFRVYNPMKPNRFHIKLFQVSESCTGYILGFHVYTGKNPSSCVSYKSKPLDQGCTKTTKIVLGLLDSIQLLDKGHHIYMDNYYTSPELFYELYYRETYACGTVRSNRKGLPNTVKNAKIETLQSVFMRNGPLLCLKWSGEKKKAKKNPVTMLSTIHNANEMLTKKKDAHGNRLPKPVCIHQYTQNMSGVDISDQYMSFHLALRKSMKWWRKLFFHMMNMTILNAYILNKKFGKKKMCKDDYVEYIANWLVDTSVEGITCRPKKQFNRASSARLVDRHFPQKKPVRQGTKVQGIMCKACNFTRKQLTEMGHPEAVVPKKTSIYWCEECEIPLCVTPCFQIYHTNQDYRNESLAQRLLNN